MKAYNEYTALSERCDKMVSEGMNACDPIVRSILHRCYKIYVTASDEEKKLIDRYDSIPDILF